MFPLSGQLIPDSTVAASAINVPNFKHGCIISLRVVEPHQIRSTSIHLTNCVCLHVFKNPSPNCLSWSRCIMTCAHMTSLPETSDDRLWQSASNCGHSLMINRCTQTHTLIVTDSAHMPIELIYHITYAIHVHTYGDCIFHDSLQGIQNKQLAQTYACFSFRRTYACDTLKAN